MPDLTSLLVADSADAWRAAGFTVAQTDGAAPRTRIGSITIELVADTPDRPSGERGIVGWRLTDLPPDTGAIDGIATADGIATTESDTVTAETPDHPNLVGGIDHVVMFTPDLDRTVAALEAAGFEARRSRDVPGAEPPRRQVFFWAGDTIVELVGPVDPTGDEPATLWGLALTCPDLDRTCEILGNAVSTPKPAVQEGRRIATMRTRDLGISTAIALMSPHPRPSEDGTARA